MNYKLVFFEDENINININDEKISIIQKSPANIQDSIDKSMYIFKYLEKILNDLSQPERSKREDLDCCQRMNDLHRLMAYLSNEPNEFYVNLSRILWQESKMRCSEHCGNTVREAK